MDSARGLIAAASVVLMRAGNDALEFLMLRRSASARAFAGAYVFPGGMLDVEDSEQRALQRLVGVTEEQAARRLRLPGPQALAHWIAAVRECCEETGVLLAVDAEGNVPTADCLRQLAGAQHFIDRLERAQLHVAADTMPYIAHWITPPVQPRRFDTRFFLAELPAQQQVRVDGVEMIDAQWLGAVEILERERRGELKLGSIATRRILMDLVEFATPAAALAHAVSVPLVAENRPRVAHGREGRRFFNHGDAPYAEIGWVDPDESGQTGYELEVGTPKVLDRHCRRLLAPNAGFMTGPGTNTYLIGEREIAVIDPGPDDPVHIDAIVAHAGGPIRWIFLTHTHPDHAPGAQALQRLTGAPILGGGPTAVRSCDVTFDRILTDQEQCPIGALQLRAIHTPGHASNHFCYLLESTRMLFSGDHLVQGFTVVIAPPDGNMRAYLDSLQRLHALDCAIIAPGHGFLIGEPKQEIERVIRHRLAREHKVLQALREQGGSGTLASLLPRVYDDVSVSLHALATRSLEAHLQKLLEDGQLLQRQGRWSFARPT
ncbi:MAG: MBL fold metallo-hydrolase [Steroidobacteraceae bacterium]